MMRRETGIDKRAQVFSDGLASMPISNTEVTDRIFGEAIKALTEGLVVDLLPECQQPFRGFFFVKVIVLMGLSLAETLGAPVSAAALRDITVAVATKPASTCRRSTSAEFIRLPSCQFGLRQCRFCCTWLFAASLPQHLSWGGCHSRWSEVSGCCFCLAT